MGINGSNGANGIGDPRRIASSNLAKVSPSSKTNVGSAFDGFHSVDGFFSSRSNESIGRALARATDTSIPIGNALSTLSSYLGAAANPGRGGGANRGANYNLAA